MKKRCIRCARLCLLSLLIITAVQAQEEPIRLEKKRELFVDHYLIDRLDNVRSVLHEPRDEGPVFFFDKPWEGKFSGYCTIIHDGAFYRAYYRGLPSVHRDYSTSETTCVAESDNGIDWRKPELGLFEIDGSAANNIVLANAAPATHNFSPFIDQRPNIDPDQRYKAVGGNYHTGLFAFVSADGIRWKKLQDEPIFKQGKFDSQNVAFWSESENRYILYFRIMSGKDWEGFRTVARTTSPDFINWSEPQAMTFGDTPMEHLYTQQTHPYFRAPHLLIAIPARFMPDRQVLTEEQAKEIGVDPNYFKDCSDAVLMSSRGGTIYDRTFMQSFIRPGIGLENWVSRSNYPALNVVQTGPTEMSIYMNQNYAQASAHLRRYSLRLDGFASLSASYGGGEMVTKILTFSGDHLVLNFATSAAGEIRVEIQDSNGIAIPGYSLHECRPIIGNEIERLVVWQTKGSDLAELAGQPVRLCFALRDADLYSLQFK
ncbi:hypothetical protein JW992_09570 [candidate division KSB1 bacterium]|nr:hypothetical protein [candidate division KSB1 bacterium]